MAGFPERKWLFHPWKHSKLQNSMDSDKTLSLDLLWRAVELEDSTDPFQPKLLCEAVASLYNQQHVEVSFSLAWNVSFWGKPWEWQNPTLLFNLINIYFYHYSGHFVRWMISPGSALKLCWALTRDLWVCIFTTVYIENNLSSYHCLWYFFSYFLINHCISLYRSCVLASWFWWELAGKWKPFFMKNLKVFFFIPFVLWWKLFLYFVWNMWRKFYLIIHNCLGLWTSDLCPLHNSNQLCDNWSHKLCDICYMSYHTELCDMKPKRPDRTDKETSIKTI